MSWLIYFDFLSHDPTHWGPCVRNVLLDCFVFSCFMWLLPLPFGSGGCWLPWLSFWLHSPALDPAAGSISAPVSNLLIARWFHRCSATRPSHTIWDKSPSSKISLHFQRIMLPELLHSSPRIFNQLQPWSPPQLASASATTYCTCWLLSLSSGLNTF